MSSKTVLGYYISLFNWFLGLLLLVVISAATTGFFISLTLYVGAISEDFKTIVDKMNNKISIENRISSKSRAKNMGLSVKLSEAISFHKGMLEYLPIFFNLK